MVETRAQSPTAATLAHRQAADNFAENLVALHRTQPALCCADLSADIEWVFGRDRALTARDFEGQWMTGCSLPRRAAAEVMRNLSIAGSVACFLSPTHGSQIRVALDRLRRVQALIAIVPDVNQLPLLLVCEHFAQDIADHRLWFVVGVDWQQMLKQLFADNPGLCTPTQFIRLPVADDSVADSLIAPAQKVFADANTERGTAIRALRQSYSRKNRRICLVAPSQFRLWDDAGASLAELLADADHVRVDLDRPTQASSLALAKAASECSAIVTANTSRADLPAALSDSLPWITWASGDRIPASLGVAPHDRLITAYPKLAQDAGWPGNQIIEATWPTAPAVETKPGPSGQGLAIILDTHPLDAPEDLTDYSSHRVLWELIAADLRDDPFVLTEDTEEFITRRLRKLDIAADSLPKLRFLVELVLPAYQQSLARLLIRQKIPVKLFGRGWDRIPEFAPLAGGAVESRAQLCEIASEAAAVLHVWPNTGPHAIDALGRPVLRRRGSHGTSFLTDARQMLAGHPVDAHITAPPISKELILRLLPPLAA